MSPEQADGRVDQLGPASDVYSLGAVLYTLLCGRAPFEFVWCDVTALFDRVRLGEFPAAAEVNARVPRALEAVCLKAMAMRAGRPLCLGRRPGRRDRAMAGRRAGRGLPRAAAGAGWRVGDGGTSRSSPARPSSCSPPWPRSRPGSSCWSASRRRPRASACWPSRKSIEATQKAESLRRRDAVSRVNLAYREYLDDNVALADELLDGCPTGPPRLGVGLRPPAGTLRAEDLPRLELKGTTSGAWRFRPTASFWPPAPALGARSGEARTGELVVRSIKTGKPSSAWAI